MKFTLVDALMSGLAVFGLKYPSLLKFDEDQDEPIIRHNLRTLYGVDVAPCDTQLREICDPLDPAAINPAFNLLHQSVRQQGLLQVYEYLDGYLLVSCDGTGQFSSSKNSCPQCCVKNHRNGTTEYYHQLLGAVVIHPDLPQVLPFLPEPILKGDGDSKNDCERNAAKRLLPRLRKDYPELRAIIVEDALAANGPHINLLKSLDYRFIIGAKPVGNASLFEQLDAAVKTGLAQAGVGRACTHARRHCCLGSEGRPVAISERRRPIQPRNVGHGIHARPTPAIKGWKNGNIRKNRRMDEILLCITFVIQKLGS